MKYYQLKVSGENLISFIKFAVMYHIRIMHSWVKDDSFLSPPSHYFMITDQGGGGITTEEKARLIDDQNFVLFTIKETGDIS